MPILQPQPQQMNATKWVCRESPGPRPVLDIAGKPAAPALKEYGIGGGQWGKLLHSAYKHLH